MTKQNKNNNNTKSSVKDKLYGIYIMSVLASILFMLAIIFMGTDDIISKVLTVPSMLFVAVELCKRFVK